MVDKQFDLTKDGSRVLTLRVPLTMLTALEAMADDLGITPPQIIRHLIQAELQRHEQKETTR